jgi:hypothetical protein
MVRQKIIDKESGIVLPEDGIKKSGGGLNDFSIITQIEVGSAA